MRRPFVAGNWKMNGNQKSCHDLLTALSKQISSTGNVELAVFPPFVYLTECAIFLSHSVIAWGAQNVSEFSQGAYTGEVSASMLKEMGCKYVIVGHSERRKLFHESNEAVAQKFLAVMQAGLLPILCVGETLEERKAEKTLEIVQEQLAVVLALKDNCTDFSNAVIAYEPVWAIGTGLSATPEQAQAVHAFIRSQIASDKMRILYGGSVTPDNAKALFAMPDIDGALVGGASLDANKFSEIAKLCNN